MRATTKTKMTSMPKKTAKKLSPATEPNAVEEEISDSVFSKVGHLFSKYDADVADSFYDQAKKYAGSVSSGLGDLSSNKKYMEGFGRSRNESNS